MGLIGGKFYECKQTFSFKYNAHFLKSKRYEATSHFELKDEFGKDFSINPRAPFGVEEGFFETHFYSVDYPSADAPKLPKVPEAEEDQPSESKKPANMLDLQIGKYYECKKSSEADKRYKFVVGRRYLADGKCHLIDQNGNRNRIFRSEFQELFYSYPLDTREETPIPTPKAPDAQNLPKDPSVKKSLADEAYELIGGDRLEEYGDMRKSFENIGKVWSVLLGVPVSAEKVALMMVGLKLVRENNKHKRDNLVDCIGYAVLLGRLEGEE